MKRYLFDTIHSDLGKKMVLLTGPRQVGKTTLAKGLMAGYPNGQYLNWGSLITANRVSKEGVMQKPTSTTKVIAMAGLAIVLALFLASSAAFAEEETIGSDEYRMSCMSCRISPVTVTTGPIPPVFLLKSRRITEVKNH